MTDLAAPQTVAVHLHELYESFRRVGFGPIRAFTLTAVVAPTFAHDGFLALIEDSAPPTRH